MTRELQAPPNHSLSAFPSIRKLIGVPQTPSTPVHTTGTIAPTTIRLLIASHDLVARNKLVSLAKKLPPIGHVVEVRNGKEAVDSYFRNRPDILFIDLRIPVLNCITAIHAICAKIPAARIVLLTSSPKENWVNKGLRAGAKGFLLKNANLQEFADCVYRVSGGRSYTPCNQEPPGPTGKTDLTRREIEVLRLMAADMSNGEIGAALFITEGTVKIHVHHILSKFGVESRSGAITEGIKCHLLQF
jgi:two-component system NarL family response regulator